ncbi:MAG: tail fiber protein [Flavobacteriales bacterium]|nr:tail fiber protein [Flavobacteriales bacterium]
MYRLSRITAKVAVALTVFVSVNVMAQTNNVGIGTTTPDPTAILEVANPYNPILGVRSKGMLIPYLNQLQRSQMEAAYNDTIANGLLTYDPENGNFWYYKYDSPVPATAPFGDWYSLTTTIQAQNSNVPVGGIIMWSGTIASIPSGWALCNGANGTPDLTDKFIISVASAAENPGTAPVNGFFVDVEPGSVVAPDRRFFKLAYIMKL